MEDDIIDTDIDDSDEFEIDDTTEHFRSWHAIAAAIAVAVIGVCIAIRRVYKKNNKEEAEKLEREGDQIEERALKEAQAAYR